LEPETSLIHHHYPSSNSELRDIHENECQTSVITVYYMKMYALQIFENFHITLHISLYISNELPALSFSVHHALLLLLFLRVHIC